VLKRFFVAHRGEIAAGLGGVTAIAEPRLRRRTVRQRPGMPATPAAIPA
jgi:hypothetical protein